MTLSERWKSLWKRRPQNQHEVCSGDATEPQPPPSNPPVIHNRRQSKKDRLFLQWLGLLGLMVAVSCLCVACPLLFTHPRLGKTVLLAMPPNLFIVVSWMVGAWYTYDKSCHLGLVVIVLTMPVRLAFFVTWIWLMSSVPVVDVQLLVIIMVVFWGLFAVPEFAMFISFTKNL